MLTRCMAENKVPGPQHCPQYALRVNSDSKVLVFVALRQSTQTVSMRVGGSVMSLTESLVSGLFQIQAYVFGSDPARSGLAAVEAIWCLQL